MIADAGRSKLHRYYTIQDGNHVDDRHDTFPTEIRPILPCYREAFLRLTAWVTSGDEAAGQPDGGAAGLRRRRQHLSAARAASSTGSKPGNGNGRPGVRPRRTALSCRRPRPL